VIEKTGEKNVKKRQESGEEEHKNHEENNLDQTKKHEGAIAGWVRICRLEGRGTRRVEENEKSGKRRGRDRGGARGWMEEGRNVITKKKYFPSDHDLVVRDGVPPWLTTGSI